MSLLLLFKLGGGGSAPIFVSKGYAGKKQTRRKYQRQEVREALMLAWKGEPETVKAIIKPLAPFAEVTPNTISFDRLMKDLAKVEEILEIALRTDDEEAILLLI